MDAEEGAERLKNAFVDRLKRVDSLAEASRRLGEAEGFLAEQKDHPRGVRPLDAMRSLEALGNPMPEEVYHEAFFSEEKDPARILAYSREHQKLRPDPFVVGCLPRLEVLAAAGPTPEGSWTSQEAAIRDLDRLRRRNRTSALKKLQKLIAAALDQLESGDRPRPAFADLCSALGVLAAIYRLAGRRDDALDLLVLAYPLVLHSKEFKSEAEWYQKAAFLLVDLNRSARAKNFLDRAHHLYDLAESAAGCVRTLVDYSYVLTEERRHQESLDILERVLPRLPEADLEGRTSAHQFLAANYGALGNLPAAWDHLDQAIALVGDDLLSKAFCLSRRAELQVRTGDLNASVASHREALPLFAKITGAGELAELAMNCASLLLKLGQRSELRQLAADLAGWIERLKGNLKLRTAIEDFQALMDLDDLNDHTFETIREQVTAAVSMSRYRAKSESKKV